MGQIAVGLVIIPLVDDSRGPSIGLSHRHSPSDDDLNGRVTEHFLGDVPDHQSIDQRSAVASDYDRIEVVGSIHDRPSRMSQLNLGRDFDIILGGEFLSVIEHLLGALLGGLFNVLLKSK